MDMYVLPMLATANLQPHSQALPRTVFIFHPGVGRASLGMRLANPRSYLFIGQNVNVHQIEIGDAAHKFQYYIFLSAVTVLGFVQTDVTVFESDGVVKLTVAITVTSPTFENEPPFTLLVNTMDGRATGLPWYHCKHQQLHTSSSLIHTHIHISSICSSW